MADIAVVRYAARMTATKDAVLAQALSLNEPDRLEIIRRLSESLETEGDSEADVLAAWELEIDRRDDEIEAGRMQCISWEEARRQIMGEADAPST